MSTCFERSPCKVLRFPLHICILNILDTYICIISASFARQVTYMPTLCESEFSVPHIGLVPTAPTIEIRTFTFLDFLHLRKRKWEWGHIIWLVGWYLFVGTYYKIFVFSLSSIWSLNPYSDMAWLKTAFPHIVWFYDFLESLLVGMGLAIRMAGASMYWVQFGRQGDTTELPCQLWKDIFLNLCQPFSLQSQKRGEQTKYQSHSG